MNIKLIIIGLIIFGMTALVSCEKEETANLNDKEQTTQISERGTITIVVSWDEWGRKKKNCDGGGLCNFTVEKVEYVNTVDKMAPILDDPNGNPYIEALVDKDLVFEDESESLYIDEDIKSIASNGLTYVMSAGVYQIDYKLGKLGGYTIPLTIKE